MAMPSSRTCRGCEAVTTNPDHVYVGFCDRCQKYNYEIYNPDRPAEIAPPIALDTIFADIQRQLRFQPSRGSLVEFGFEPTRDKDDLMRWRAYVKVNGRVAEYSRRAQATPQDALRELWHLCTGTAPEDI